MLSTFVPMLPDHQLAPMPHDQFHLLATRGRSSLAPSTESSIDLQRIYNAIFTLCKEIAFALTRRVLYYHKVGSGGGERVIFLGDYDRCEGGKPEQSLPGHRVEAGRKPAIPHAVIVSTPDSL